MKNLQKTVSALFLWLIQFSCMAQGNLLSNGGFEGIVQSGAFPQLGEALSDHCAPSWFPFNGGTDDRWFIDSVWIPMGNNGGDPEFQAGYYKVGDFNSARPWGSGDALDTLFRLPAKEGLFYIGFDAQTNGFFRQGVQAKVNTCGLNSGTYLVNLHFARAYGSLVTSRIFLSLSDSYNSRRRIVNDFTVSHPANNTGQWDFHSSMFTIDINNQQDQHDDWFSITGQAGGDSDPRNYVFIDDVSLWRPCDDILECFPTHGQICPDFVFPQTPGDLLKVSNISNASDLHLKLSTLGGVIIKDTIYHNANGLPDFRLDRLAVPISLAALLYQYDIEITNSCGGIKKTGHVNIYDTAAYNPIIPYRDTTANWTGVPIPCCLNTLTLQNTQIVGDVSFIVRNEIIVQSGVSLAPNSHVTLQAGNVTELSNVDFDGSNSSLEIIEVPCPNRMACGDGCGGGAMVIDAGQFVIPETLTSFEDSVENLAAIKSNSQSTMLEEPPMPQEISLGAFPNPFAKDLQIGFELPEEMICSLQVTDIHLRTVNIALKESKMPAGSNQLVLDLGNLPSGIYFVKLEANGRMFHQRVVKQ
jgi:hypothetical protein